MPDYMLMVLEDEDAHAAQAPAAMARLIEERAKFIGELRSAGRLRDHGRLRPSKEGKRLRRASEGLVLEGGPFADEGRSLGAYCWLEASTLDEAARLAADYPILSSDRIDVRPVMKGRIDPDKEAKPGKLFGFVVLGNAVSEDAWVSVMDRIEEETHVRLPDSFIGGVRLEPPRSGRRVERRAMLDGPFLESREVIGGLFLLRVASLDDAVRWAGETRHGVHGALEIRELWRS